MKFLKLPLFSAICASLLNAGLVDGVAIIVNKEPVTLYEVHKYSQKFKVGKTQAIDMLIQEKIEEIEIKKRGMSADMFDVDSEIEKIAKQNKLSRNEFLDLLKDKGVSISQYKEDLQDKIKREKLYEKIAVSKMNKIEEEELKRYYNNNINEFSTPENFEVVKYESTSKEAIEKAKANPMQKSQEVGVEEAIISSKNLNPKLFFLLNDTKEGNATPIFTAGSTYTFFYLKSKMNIKSVPFEEAKKAVFNKLANQKEQALIKEHFDKLKAEAKIEVVREP